MKYQFIQDCKPYKKGQIIEFTSAFWCQYYLKKGLIKPLAAKKKGGKK